jgi:hypothetical protein
VDGKHAEHTRARLAARCIAGLGVALICVRRPTLRKEGVDPARDLGLPCPAAEAQRSAGHDGNWSFSASCANAIAGKKNRNEANFHIRSNEPQAEPPLAAAAALSTIISQPSTFLSTAACGWLDRNRRHVKSARHSHRPERRRSAPKLTLPQTQDRTEMLSRNKTKVLYGPDWKAPKVMGQGVK